MAPEDIRESLKRQPFEPFRMVMTDGTTYNVPHPDLVWLGKRSLMYGITVDASSTLYEQSIKIDLLHISRIEPVPQSPKSNGQV